MAVTTAAVVGIAASGASAVQGFMNASAQKNAAAKAEKAAQRAMAQARRQAEVDNYAGLDVPLDAFAAQNEANIAADKQAMEALQEGDSRALAAGVGRVGAQQAAGTEQTRIAMADEMFNIDKMKADSKEAIKQQMIAMDVGEAKMQDQRAREAAQMRQQAIQQGIQGIQGVAQGVGDLAPLYGKSQNDKRTGAIVDNQDFQKGYNAKRTAAGMDAIDFSNQAQRNSIFNQVSNQGITGKGFRGMNRSGNYADVYSNMTFK